MAHFRASLARLGLISLAALAAWPDAASAARAPIHECDRLAAHPADPQKVGDGVQWDLIDARSAIPACRDAVQRWPDEMRFKFQLGRVLLFAKRRDEGMPYLFSAADSGYLIAYSNIGGTYQFDLGNYAEALKWYRRGAALGDVSAQAHLAEMYLDGTGVDRNLAEAMRWYQPSAADGYPLSVYKIGLIYSRGDKTVKRDHETANAFFAKAAEMGFARAQNDLGNAFERGLGVRRNQKTAAEWYRRAAEQGWALAQFNLARLYEEGIGVKEDKAEALYWYRLSSKGRDSVLAKDAKRAATRVARRVDGKEVAEVDARINAWRSVTEAESAAEIAAAGQPLPVSTQQAEVVLASVEQTLPSGGVDPGYAPPGGAPAGGGTSGAGGVDAGYQPPGSSAPAQGTVDAAYQPPAQQTAPAQVAAVSPAPKKQSFDVDFGRYHALVIGNNDYTQLNRLETAINDARTVAKTLRELYGFRVQLLLNATRYDILKAFSKLRASLQPQDNLLVYYAGHGFLDDAAQAGYWLPVDAESDNVANWIANDDLTRAIRTLDAKHVMLVVDSCYSGTLLRDADIKLKTGGETAMLKRFSDKRARTVLTSGGVEPVVDGGGGGHSVFAKAFLDALAENPGALLGQDLYAKLRRPVMLNADQTPEYADIRKAGHEGGDFIFVRR